MKELATRTDIERLRADLVVGIGLIIVIANAAVTIALSFLIVTA